MTMERLNGLNPSFGWISIPVLGFVKKKKEKKTTDYKIVYVPILRFQFVDY